MPGFRAALRALLRTPVATAVAILSLALSIGANTGAFSVLNALLFRAVAVPHPHELVAISVESPDYAETRLTPDVFRSIAADASLFSGVFAWQGDYPVLDLEANGVRSMSTVARVAGDYFGTLGIRPYMGRFFSPNQRDRVAVIDYQCWARRFGRDPGVIGKEISVSGVAYTVIGVTPREFTGLEVEVAPEVTIPFDPEPSNRLGVVARLRPGVTIAAARGRMDALWRELPVDHARRLRVAPFATGFSFFRERQVPTLTALLALAGPVLLIACLNLAMLTLARASARRHELGVRIALGAGRARLLARLFSEALLVAAAGGALGLVFAAWAGRWLVGMLWSGIVPTAIDPSPDPRVFAFAAALSLAAALLFGLAPAHGLFRLSASDALRAAPRTVAGSGAVAGRIMVAAQIALSLALVSGALLVARSLQKVRSADLGFNRDRLLTVRLFPRTRDPIPNRAAYYRELSDALQGIPGVESVAYCGMGPVSPGMMTRRFSDTDATVDFAGPAFFRSLGVRLLSGREFNWSDDEHTPLVTVVSDALAARLFPGANAIGRALMFDGRSATIVGVVSEARFWNPRRRTPMAAYFPLLQQSDVSGWVDVRAVRNPAALVGPVRRVLDSLGRHTALSTQTMEDRLDATLAPERMAAALAGFLGGLALLLAAIGIYGLMQNTVARRTPEFGIRAAVGASPADLTSLILREVGAMLAAGLAAGIPAALWCARLLSGVVFGVPPSDPWILLLSVAVLTMVPLLATWRPARRAATVDPLEALRDS